MWSLRYAGNAVFVHTALLSDHSALVCVVVCSAYASLVYRKSYPMKISAENFMFGGFFCLSPLHVTGMNAQFTC